MERERESVTVRDTKERGREREGSEEKGREIDEKIQREREKGREKDTEGKRKTLGEGKRDGKLERGRNGWRGVWIVKESRINYTSP